MRSFPSASRRRLAATATVAAVVLGATSIPFAQARDDGDELEDRRDAVQGQIAEQERTLEHASKAAQRAADRVVAAERSLAEAQARLADVGEQLDAARARDAATQQALAEAEAELVTAQAELDAGRAAALDQRDTLADSVVTTYEQGDPRLRALSSLMGAESLEDLELRLEAEKQVIANEGDAFTDLKEAEERLAEQERTVAAARREANRQRMAAAVNLARIEDLEERAAAETASVRELVQAAREARRDSVRLRERDRAVLKRLQAREDAIKQRILAAAARDRRNYTGDTDGILGQPVDGYVTSPFGYRIHPIYGYRALHNGTDFGAPCGAPLFASAAGTVVETYYDSAFGNRLFLSIGNVNGANITLVYNHLSGYRASAGDKVARGDVVGLVGTTGWSTGCHLHFTVLRNGEAVDPMPYL